MTVTDAMPLEWTPPGEGSWQIVADHYSRPLTRVMEPWCAVWSAATTEALHAVGLPVERAEMAPVNGIPYLTMHGADGPTPPAWLMGVLVRVVPSLRRANRELGRLVASRGWLDHAKQWFEVDRPVAVARARALTDVDPAVLDDAALGEHLRTVHDHVFASGAQHIAMGMVDTIAIGLFVVAAEDWGIERRTAFGLLAGSSPASSGQHPELLAVREALGGRTIASLVDARSAGPAVVAALDEYLLVHGHRVVDGYDVDSTTLLEQPGLVLRLVHGEGRRVTAPDPAPVRARVPAADRARFDQLLADARVCYGVRDDNNGILVGWAVGLLRRSMLEVGRRVSPDDPTLALEASLDELLAALAGGGPDVDAWGRRRTRRFAVRSSDAPRLLGPPPAPPPVLPGVLGSVLRVFDLFEDGAGDRQPLEGLGIGDVPCTGRARILTAGLDLDDFEPGDVLVAPMTAPSCNVLLSIAGAVVTEEGGVMSHAAMMARELGLPAVLGVADATDLIPDGATVTVDPSEGQVRVHG